MGMSGLCAGEEGACEGRGEERRCPQAPVLCAGAEEWGLLQLLPGALESPCFEICGPIKMS